MRSNLMSSEPVYEENYFGGNGDNPGDRGDRVLASESLLHHFDNMGLINAYVPFPVMMHKTSFCKVGRYVSDILYSVAPAF